MAIYCIGCQSLFDENEQLRAQVEAQAVEVTESTISRVQREQKPWVAHNFGNRPGWMPVMGLMEELGELSHAFLKRAQMIRGAPEKHTADIRDAAGDLVIFLCDLASTEGFDLDQVVSETWDMVRKRDFKADQVNGGGHDHKSTPAPPEGADLKENDNAKR